MEQRAWLLSCTRDTWVRFRSEFLRLWDEQGTKGDAYPAALFGGDAPQGLRARPPALRWAPLLGAAWLMH